ncbi:tyrosine-type recombinase/integrase [Mycobacterium sp.]|uniref:tyrosine-type recombinase/integrase n=1 Tax=Mycobacterium sp. TaxID=1785 RepID=UPI003F9E3CA6
MSVILDEKWPVLRRHERAREWLQIWVDLGRAPRTIDAYARGLAEYLLVCEREGIDPVSATRAQIALFIRELRTRPSLRGPKVVVLDSGSGLANATLQQRLVPVRLFYDFLVEEGVRESNPVGRGRYTAGRGFGGGQPRPLVARMVKLPWIPGEAEWLRLLGAFRVEPIRNRLMLALAYDAALRREELCSLRTEDLDPAHRTLRVRAETTKTRRGRVVPYSAATGVLLSGYLAHRAQISRARGPLFLSESRRNRGEPLSLWTWSKVVRRVALAADVPQFSTHTTRHLCLTDLARMRWELHTKPVDPLLGQAIEAWQALRPAQPTTLDRKTSEHVHMLFAVRAHPVAKNYINRTIIPALCARAGVPSSDVRGKITSHRARSTIASQLYNAKEPMTLFELQAWLGHRTPNTTQHYAKISPNTLSKAYTEAGYFARNVRTIEVLLDREAITSGAAATGQPWQHYDLGHGWCSYSFFEQCQHRMACARCDFYTPKDSTKAQLLEASGNLQRMLATIPLTDDERAAVDDGHTAVTALLDRLADVPTPAGPTPRELATPATVTMLPIVQIRPGKA